MGIVASTFYVSHHEVGCATTDENVYSVAVAGVKKVVLPDREREEWDFAKDERIKSRKKTSKAHSRE